MNEKIRAFTDLVAWQVAKDLTLLIYKVTNDFPQSELFALTNQMRRAAISVASNIAEGFSRRSKLEKRQFYAIAKASLTELENQIIISREIGYVNELQSEQLRALSTRCGKLIVGLLHSLF